MCITCVVKQMPLWQNTYLYGKQTEHKLILIHLYYDKSQNKTKLILFLSFISLNMFVFTCLHFLNSKKWAYCQYIHTSNNVIQCFYFNRHYKHDKWTNTTNLTLQTCVKKFKKLTAVNVCTENQGSKTVTVFDREQVTQELKCIFLYILKNHLIRKQYFYLNQCCSDFVDINLCI